MKNIADKLSQEQYQKNFEEITPPFTPNSAVAEANRCLYCYDSPCKHACPTHIDIPGFIKKISSGNLLGSAKTIFQSNWAALTCAKACPVEVLCEGSCVYVNRNEKPIEIGRLQRYAIDNFFEKGMPKLFSSLPKNGKSVGVIGSGPAGLACSSELALMGYDVTIYEAKEIPGGLDTWGIAPYKMKQEDSLKEVKLVESFGVNIKLNSKVGDNISYEDLIKNHDALFVGVGLGKSNLLNIKGKNLKGILGALEFIYEVKKEKWSQVDVGKKVAIIGAGNTAIDAATEAKRLGAEEVHIIYHRGENEMSAYDFEYEHAKHDGVIFNFLTQPKRFIGKEFVEAIECVKMKLHNETENGKRKVTPINGSEFLFNVDMVIIAIGQQQSELINKLPGVKVNKGKVVVNEKFQTDNPKIFAGGDCINGGKEVVNAAYDGKNAAHGINEYLNSLIK